MKQKNYEVEYRDSIGMKCMEEIHGVSERKAIQNLQFVLIKDGSYMSQLIDIQEVNDSNNDGEWSIENGPVLDQESQDTLNQAMGSYTNSSGLTLEEAMEKASQRRDNK